MPIMFSTIDCAQEGDVQENLDWTTGKITASVKLRCDWVDRLYLADDILLNRRVYPLILTAFSPRALTAAITQGDSDGNAVTDGQWRPPRTALVTINYGVPETDSTSTFDVVAESLEPIGEFTKLGHSAFRWGSQAGLPLVADETPGFLDVKLRLVRRLYRLNTIPPAALGMYGKCNSNTYVSPILGMTFLPETILYDAPQPEMTVANDGTRGFNLTQNFIYSPNGWNKYFDIRTSTWVYIYHVSSSSPFKSYVPDDFSGIL